MKQLAILLITIVTLSACGGADSKSKSSKSEGETADKPISNTKKELQDGMYARFTTNAGVFTARLEMDKAPLTVANFVALAEGTMPNNAKELGIPFYDGLQFHRVISKPNGDNNDFMVQGGDPAGNGSGGPGYRFKDEFHPSLRHRHGVLSMANSGPGTNGSQFFICVSEPSHLDGKHSVFGEVIDGYEIVYKTKQHDIIKSVEILRKGEAATNFDAFATFNTLR
jgi:peptidyl-prolyl cis-trans isomerase A (cyclophilin A)